ncbi:MAG TPA: hypothetical protein VK272_05020 [Solirubrobacteraceae bacterium]|nr:hypothetical protein [Solirubrobacteraceae bacterium]
MALLVLRSMVKPAFWMRRAVNIGALLAAVSVLVAIVPAPASASAAEPQEAVAQAIAVEEAEEAEEGAESAEEAAAEAEEAAFVTPNAMAAVRPASIRGRKIGRLTREIEHVKATVVRLRARRDELRMLPHTSRRRERALPRTRAKLKVKKARLRRLRMERRKLVRA